MDWEIEVTDQFTGWYLENDESAQIDIEAAVELLEQSGPSLGRPAVDTIKQSAYPNMKELRVQSNGRPLRIFFAFDPRRAAILLIGGNKARNDRFYEEYVPIADRLYTGHLKETQHG